MVTHYDGPLHRAFQKCPTAEIGAAMLDFPKKCVFLQIDQMVTFLTTTRARYIAEPTSTPHMKGHYMGVNLYRALWAVMRRSSAVTIRARQCWSLLEIAHFPDPRLRFGSYLRIGTELNFFVCIFVDGMNARS